MTESPQQPGYAAPQPQPQQQQAYTGQQPAYQPQAYQAPAPAGPSLFEKLPMNPLTFGLAVGGAVLLFLSAMIHGAGSNAILVLRIFSPMALFPIYAIVVLTAITICSGPRFRNTLRATVTGLAALELGATVSIFMFDPSEMTPSNPISGESVTEGSEIVGGDIVGILLYVIALGLLVAANFTMGEPKPAPNYGQQPPQQYAQHTGTIPVVQPDSAPPATAPTPQQYQDPQQRPDQQGWQQ